MTTEFTNLALYHVKSYTTPRNLCDLLCGTKTGVENKLNNFLLIKLLINTN